MVSAPPLPAISTGGAVHRIQYFLIDTRSCSTAQLIAAGDLISRPDFEDVIVERTIAGFCGYPLCPNLLPADRSRHGRFRISLREHRVYDLEETYKYCSEECFINSRTFSASLGEERVSDVGEAKIEQVLRLFGYGKDGDGGLGVEGDLDFNRLSIKEKADAGAGEVSLDEWIGPANAVEGYVPQHNRAEDSGPNLISERNSKKMIEDAGKTVIFTSVINSDETVDSISVSSSSVKEEFIDMIPTRVEEARISEVKTRSQKSTSRTSKGKKETKLDDYECGNMNFTSSITVGDEFDNQKASSSTRLNISEMIAKQLEDVALKENETKKIYAMSKSTRFRYPLNPDDTANGKLSCGSSLIDGNDVDMVTAMASPDICGSSSKTIPGRIEKAVSLEKKIGKKSSKLVKPKSMKKMIVNDSNKVDIDCSSSILKKDNAVSSNVSPLTQGSSKELGGDMLGVSFPKEIEETAIYKSLVPSGSKKACSQVSVEEFDGVISLERNTASEEKQRKSSLKTSQSRDGHRSVKWADENEIGTVEDKRFIQESLEDTGDSIRFASAEACAAALAEASASVASGKAEVEDAVLKADILILPQLQPVQREMKEDDDFFEFDRGIVKWPTKTVLLDTDMFEIEDSWHDTPPEGFNLNLSPFATMWMALFGWISCSTLYYIYERDGSSLEDFMLVNGREYPQKAASKDGQSSEIRKTLETFICRTLPGLIMVLRLPMAISTLEQFMGRLIETMSFMDAMPSLKIKQWRVIVLLFLEALSIKRLPALAPYFLNSNVPCQVLNSAQINNEQYETMRELILPLGRSPEFAVSGDR
ncbi:Putative RNA polymerase II subunit B1 CTD phosphatase RPAP2 like [Apostasia shenzhenica]|uniref:RNA polymerase II subunit B1 CTD phosphatase RPAP2 homolog n=1 Tax=Apostasia shenzhenica TaxID=1088818 RepID=A0A2I0AGM3_9ASPA|nr:Putative RNA polymerase II subunit B1 CTD phosphatase RPAP2 like [Apostasia shenzhenica]